MLLIMMMIIIIKMIMAVWTVADLGCGTRNS